jgi:cbb3-type cytochrome oxidase cytochrome c subunit
MTLEELKEKHLDLYNQIFDEGKKEGIKTENERIKAIEDLGVPGFEDLVTKAKFENKDTAEKLAMDIIKAQKNLGKDYLDDLKKDAKDLDDVKGSEAPENKAEEKDVKEGASLIAKFANKKRGGKE